MPDRCVEVVDEDEGGLDNILADGTDIWQALIRRRLLSGLIEGNKPG